MPEEAKQCCKINLYRYKKTETARNSNRSVRLVQVYSCAGCGKIRHVDYAQQTISRI